MRHLGAIPKRIPSCPRNLAYMLYPPRSNTLIRSAPARALAPESQGMGIWPPGDRPSYSYRIPEKSFGEWWGIPPRIHTAVASVTLGANVEGLLLGLQLRFIVVPISYRPGRPGAAAE